MSAKGTRCIKVDKAMHNVLRLLAAIRNVPMRVVATEIIASELEGDELGQQLLALRTKQS